MRLPNNSDQVVVLNCQKHDDKITTVTPKFGETNKGLDLKNL